ncbi:MAG: peptide deformylase [Acutalibacteraceae bacterium]|nr:peptide deformylase [Acutalibacteraceae bacterium]
MERKIEKDVLFLSQKSQPATMADLPVAIDLEDTLMANRERCVGLAANMIGEKKCIITFAFAMGCLTMFNPQIIKKSQPYDTVEGCLSLCGERPTKRYEVITVKYQDKSFKWHTQEFRGYVAQIIQHEIDHCNGIII